MTLNIRSTARINSLKILLKGAKAGSIGFLAFVLTEAAIPKCAALEPTKVMCTLHKTDGTDLTGLLKKLGDDWSVTLGGSKNTAVDKDHWICLRQADKSLPSMPFQGEQLRFANGDCLRAKILETKGGRLHFQMVEAVGSETIQVSVSALSLIWLKAPENIDDLDVWRWKRGNETRTRDKAWLTNGDEIDGILKGLDASKIIMEVNRKAQEIPRDKVAVLGLSTELTSTLKPKSVFGRVILSDGARLSLLKASCSEGSSVAGETLFSQPVTLASDTIRALYLNHGPAVYLSDLKARDYEFTSYLSSTRWPYVKDGCVQNHEIHLDGSSYAKGLGMHSQSRLTYDLAGKYRRFEALVGLDENSGQKGTARINVLVDGKPRELGEKTDLKGLDKPVSLSLDVSGAKLLTLGVDFGKRGSVQSHVDWADARLIK